MTTVGIFPFFGKVATNHTLSDNKVKELIHRTDLHFDIVVSEEIYHDAYLMFGHKFKAPVVTICGFDIEFPI